MDINQHLFTENDCYKTDRYMSPKGGMLHSTGKNNPYLNRYLPGDEIIGYNKYDNHWNMPGLNVCVHGFIGKDKNDVVRLYQTLDFNLRGWHCASGENGSGNDYLISIEICEDGLDDAGYFWQAYSLAAQFFAYAAKLYSFTANEVICHSEGYEQGIASNHADVMHWFSRFGVTMDDFRAAVEAELNKEEDMEGKDIYEKLVAYLETLPTSDYAKESSEKGVAAGVFMDGDKDGLVDNPKGLVTREQLAVVLNRVGSFDK
jgi:hypothetical protein